MPRALQPRRLAARGCGPPLDPAGRLGELFFPVAQNEDRRRTPGRRQPPARPAPAADDAAGSRVSSDLRQRIVQPLVPARGEQRFGGDDVDALEAGQARQEIEVGRPQAPRVRPPDRRRSRRCGGTAAGRRRDSSSVRSACSSIRPLSAIRRSNAANVAARNCVCLQQALGATVGVAPGVERVADDAIERVDGAPAAPQLVVERQHRSQESRTKAERWRRSPARGHRLPPAAAALRARTPSAAPERRAGGRAARRRARRG